LPVQIVTGLLKSDPDMVERAVTAQQPSLKNPPVSVRELSVVVEPDDGTDVCAGHANTPAVHQTTPPAPCRPRPRPTYGQPMQHWLDLTVALPAGRGHMDVVAALKADHALGHGHANAIVSYFRAQSTTISGS
jgi:hypothetical protein